MVSVLKGRVVASYIDEVGVSAIAAARGQVGEQTHVIDELRDDFGGVREGVEEAAWLLGENINK